MALHRMQFRPGVNKQFTPTLNEGGWSECNLVRFRDGLPEPIGGWVNTLSTSFAGVCRKLHAWATLRATTLVAIGTSSGLYLDLKGTLYDVTPVASSATLANPFTATGNPAIVAVTDPKHGRVVGDLVIFAGSTVIANGSYQVLAVTSADAYTIAAAITGIPGPNGDAVSVSRILGAGLADATFGGGWGSGAWGSGAWGATRGDLVFAQAPRLWSIDHWGEELIAAVRDGGIYNWKPADGYSARATVLSPNAPQITKTILTAMPERHLCAYGAESGGVQDPMLVRWCDVENYTDWTASATNSAGSYRIVGGSAIQTALACQQEILIWTDAVLWAQRFQGLPYVYGFFLQGDGCGLIAPNAAIVAGGVAYWMSRTGFYRYSGQVLTIECPVWDSVFEDLNDQQIVKITAGRNAAFHEIMWFYPSEGSIENDRVVAVNVLDGTWWLGALSRTAWEDAGLLLKPIGTDGSTGHLYRHEVGTDADGAPLHAYIESGYFDLSDGDVSMDISVIIPDFANRTGPVSITIKGQSFPDGPQRVKGPFQVMPSTRQITARMSERQMLIRIESNTLGADWRLGALRVKTAPAGRKG